LLTLRQLIKKGGGIWPDETLATGSLDQGANSNLKKGKMSGEFRKIPTDFFKVSIS